MQFIWQEGFLSRRMTLNKKDNKEQCSNHVTVCNECVPNLHWGEYRKSRTQAPGFDGGRSFTTTTPEGENDLERDSLICWKIFSFPAAATQVSNCCVKLPCGKQAVQLHWTVQILSKVKWEVSRPNKSKCYANRVGQATSKKRDKQKIIKLQKWTTKLSLECLTGVFEFHLKVKISFKQPIN